MTYYFALWTNRASVADISFQTLEKRENLETRKNNGTQQIVVIMTQELPSVLARLRPVVLGHLFRPDKMNSFNGRINDKWQLCLINCAPMISSYCDFLTFTPTDPLGPAGPISPGYP